ncbi:hypothetical protein EDB81DRAFT_856108 [Dactylonectria macrodidyma]|uniref:Uncharacterized protein n=1 Tax=Dactylonectria macrodidyma TaxID=307937 RepID=A0A9P9EZL5_9HYPO|nr:hypothetical protein EDB81DRAFT_856108 [Dactylonectria macrodidyma]
MHPSRAVSVDLLRASTKGSQLQVGLGGANKPGPKKSYTPLFAGIIANRAMQHPLQPYEPAPHYPGRHPPCHMRLSPCRQHPMFISTDLLFPDPASETTKNNCPSRNSPFVLRASYPRREKVPNHNSPPPPVPRLLRVLPALANPCNSPEIDDKSWAAPTPCDLMLMGVVSKPTSKPLFELSRATSVPWRILNRAVVGRSEGARKKVPDEHGEPFSPGGRDGAGLFGLGPAPLAGLFLRRRGWLQQHDSAFRGSVRGVARPPHQLPLR